MQGPVNMRVRAAVVGRNVVCPESVLVAPGRRVAVITEVPVVVPNVRFVRRRIAMGDLVEVPESEE